MYLSPRLLWQCNQMVGYVEITSSALIMEPTALEETLGYHFAQDSPFR